MVRSAGFALVVVALTMLLGPVADAAPGQGKAKGARPQGKGMHAEILKRFDKDGDGKLNEAERAAAKKAHDERGGQAGGGDGKRREEIIKRFDKDGDGKLNEAERAAAKKAHDERGNKKKK